MKRPRDRNKWEILKTCKKYIVDARDAREAIFAGQWGTATFMCFFAGTNYLPRQIVVGRRHASIQGRGMNAMRKDSLAKRNEKIVAEALRIQAGNSHLKLSRIAAIVADNHAAEPNFPKKDAIRKVLTQSGKLGKQRLHSQ